MAAEGFRLPGPDTRSFLSALLKVTSNYHHLALASLYLAIEILRDQGDYGMFSSSEDDAERSTA